MQYIYLFRAHLPGEYLYKIGYSIDPQQRLSDLQPLYPFQILLVRAFRTLYYQVIEIVLHLKYAAKRANLGIYVDGFTEWFRFAGPNIEGRFWAECKDAESSEKQRTAQLGNLIKQLNLSI